MQTAASPLRSLHGCDMTNIDVLLIVEHIGEQTDWC